LLWQRRAAFEKSVEAGAPIGGKPGERVIACCVSVVERTSPCGSFDLYSLCVFSHARKQNCLKRSEQWYLCEAHPTAVSKAERATSGKMSLGGHARKVIRCTLQNVFAGHTVRITHEYLRYGISTVYSLTIIRSSSEVIFKVPSVTSLALRQK
jgi:hypothetical protein